MRLFSRGRSAILSGLAVGGLVLSLQAPAYAGEDIVLSDGSGIGIWSADPSSDGTEPGDAIKACDTAKDGWGIAVSLEYSGYSRYIDTGGHPSYYCTGWKTGNIKEGTRVHISVYQIKTENGVVYIGKGTDVYRTA